MVMGIYREYTSAFLIFALVGLAYGDTQPVLPEGTPVRMRLNRTLSSATAQEGDNVDFEVLDEVKVGDLVIIPQGAMALATVTEAKPKRSMGRAGHLNVNIDYVRSACGDKIPLRGVQHVKAGGHTGAMTGAIVATSIVFFPAAPLFLFMKGKDITIPKGHEITVYVNSDFKIDVARFTAPSGGIASTRATKLAGKALVNAEIISLKNAGFTDDLILAKIKGAPAAYTLETDELVVLKNAGLSEAVITAMVAAMSR
jgi:hypothetical protein